MLSWTWLSPDAVVDVVVATEGDVTVLTTVLAVETDTVVVVMVLDNT